MIRFLPDDKLFINKFTYTELPSKAQIFSRTGQRSVNPSGSYSGDESVKFGQSKTAQAAEFVQAAEAFIAEQEQQGSE